MTERIDMDEAERRKADKHARQDRALTLRKSDHMGDWYIIEWANHADSTWIENRGSFDAWMTSGRMGDADAEGYGGEMLHIATAIEARVDEEFRRVGLRFVPGGAHIYSPRNSSDCGPVLPFDVLDALAVTIRATVPTP